MIGPTHADRYKTSLYGHPWCLVRPDGTVIGYFKSSRQARVASTLHEGSKVVFKK